MSSHLSKTDTHLYRPTPSATPPATKKKKTIHPPLSTGSFTTTLSSLLARPLSPRGRARTSTSTSTSANLSSHGKDREKGREKENIFTAHKQRRRAAHDSSRDKMGTQDIGGVDAETLARSRKRMEEKAKKYARMRRGDYDEPSADGGGGDGGLIEWDRKWAEAGGELAPSDEDDDDVEEGSGTFADLEKVEFEDEYGRVREGTKAEKERMERRLRNQLRGQEELERMSARPKMPENLIRGAAVQVAAFNPEGEQEEKMEALRRKRDRSATPPEGVYYDASKEIRSRGVGFYQFSREEGKRKEEMEGLEEARRRTVGVRGEDKGEGEKGEKGGGLMARMRARREAEVFLEGLEEEVGSGETKE